MQRARETRNPRERPGWEPQIAASQASRSVMSYVVSNGNDA